MLRAAGVIAGEAKPLPALIPQGGSGLVAGGGSAASAQQQGEDVALPVGQRWQGGDDAPGPLAVVVGQLGRRLAAGGRFAEGLRVRGRGLGRAAGRCRARPGGRRSPPVGWVMAVPRLLVRRAVSFINVRSQSHGSKAICALTLSGTPAIPGMIISTRIIQTG